MVNYEGFSAEDFAMDSDFVDWVRDPRAEDLKFWEEWLARHPEKRHDVAEARRLVSLLQYEVTRPGSSAKLRVKEGIDRLLEEMPAPPAKVRTLVWYRWAAVFVGILGAVFIGTRLLAPSETVIATAYGETRTVTLDDGSVVTLNGNSTLRYVSMTSPGDREMTLAGEAYFRVRRDEARRFRVLADKVTVEVLGTEFNVNNRIGKTAVVLNSGSISISVQTYDSVEALLMEPGDMVEYSERSDEIVQKVVNPEQYASWADNILMFESISIQEIAERLSATYGYEVEVTEDVESLLFTGSAPTDNLEILLNGLRKTHGLDITVQDNRILITR